MMASAKSGTRASRARIFKVLNPFMRLMLRLPIRRMQERLLLLTYSGRRSGKRFTLPLSYARESEGSLLIPGGGAWKLNLMTGRPVTIRLHGKVISATSEVITDRAEIESLLPELYRCNDRAEPFVGVPMNAQGGLDSSRLNQALEDGFAIVRLHLTDEP